MDADIGFTPDQVFRLIESGADMVAGVYPIKRVNWDKARRAIEGRRPDVRPPRSTMCWRSTIPIMSRSSNGFTRVRYAGTGFLMIRRHVFEKMCAHPAYAPLQFFREHSLDALAGSPNRFALFECMIDPATGTYLSEDFAFCKRWTDIGGEIWADLRAGSIMSARRYSMAISRRSSPRRRLRPMRREMQAASPEPTDMARPPCADRIGVAWLTKMAAGGIDLRPLWQQSDRKLLDGTIEAGEGLDLSLIAQLLGDKPAGLAIQHEILASHQLFRSPCAAQTTAFAGARAGGCDRHRQQHADRIPAGGQRNRIDDALCHPGSRMAANRCPITTSRS